ncbi:cell wall protein [Streptomyces sp. Da 82-17]|uniref:cell wall protein n=1 Tax=Streptomyces sp. Da 82-17 TaxID=3377116 RepID=UPI0038D3A45D
MRGVCQEVHATKSRRSGPRRWRRAVVWLIAAGLHPRANATTLRVAEDLAARMDYDLGHVRYCLDETAARLGVSTATVKRHVKVLRELGALAWVVHGTRTNIRRALGLGGYAGTATVYAATIPAAYDHAMGHTIVGSGYEARIIVDQRKPVDNPGSETREPPSLALVEGEGQVQVVGGSNYTSGRGPSRSANSPSPTTNKRSSKKGSTGRSPLQVARDIQIARQVRPLVPWVQKAGLRQLGHALRPLIDRGLTTDVIVAELTSMCMSWRPASPAAYLRAELARRQANDEQAAAVAAQFELEHCAQGPWTASAPSLVADVLDGLRRGMAAYSANQRANGLDDLMPHQTDDEQAAAAAMAAFLGSPA